MAQNGIIGWKLRNGDSFRDLIVDRVRDDDGKLISIEIVEVPDRGSAEEPDGIAIDAAALPALIELLQFIERGERG